MNILTNDGTFHSINSPESKFTKNIFERNNFNFITLDETLKNWSQEKRRQYYYFYINNYKYFDTQNKYFISNENDSYNYVENYITYPKVFSRYYLVSHPKTGLYFNFMDFKEFVNKEQLNLSPIRESERTSLIDHKKFPLSFSFINLLKKFDTVCILSYDYSHVLDKSYIDEFAMKFENSQYHGLSALWSCANGGVLHMNPEVINYCKDNRSRFVILPIVLECDERNDKGKIVEVRRHANVIIIDKLNMTYELFDPWGAVVEISTLHQKYFNIKKLDRILEKLFGVLGLKKIQIRELCPEMSFQYVQEEESTNPTGFCVAWSWFYVYLRLKNPYMNQKLLQEKFIDLIRGENELQYFIIKFINRLNDEVKKNKSIDYINLFPNEYYKIF